LCYNILDKVGDFLRTNRNNVGTTVFFYTGKTDKKKKYTKFCYSILKFAPCCSESYSFRISN